MGIIGDGMFEPLRDASEQLNVRLDAILVELRTIHLLLEEMREKSTMPLAAS
ncbi:MAG: hypothetical protein M3135_02745 [Actinomycetota bacterium]|nr:hypothetical protein [Actinomycetota bacterium]